MRAVSTPTVRDGAQPSVRTTVEPSARGASQPSSRESGIIGNQSFPWLFPLWFSNVYGKDLSDNP